MECIVKIDVSGEIINPKTVRQFFNELPQDSTGTLTWKPANLRSLSQNAYYHSVCVPMIKDGLREVGYDDIRTNEQAHNFLKAKFLRQYAHNRNNPEEVLDLGAGSTTELTTVMFMAYIAEIQKFAAEFLNITIPDPGQQSQIDYPTEPLPQY